MLTLKNPLSYLLFASLTLLNGCGDDGDSLIATISVSPNEAPVGRTVTITGANFSLTPSANVVEFNGVLAAVTSCTNTSIQVKVPKGATNGRVTVTTNGNIKATSAVDFVVTDCSECGIIEKFVSSNDYGYKIEPINATKLMYASDMATRRGFNFEVDKKIRVKSIGGLFRKKGSYTMELHAFSDVNPLVHITTISVNDTENFTYEDVGIDIQLIPGVEYFLRYCSDNHDSVYDFSPSSPAASYLQPFDFGVINLTSLSYEYMADCSKSTTVYGWRTSALFMRGIVDFKYEVIE